MITLHLLCMIIAVVLLLLAGIGVAIPRVAAGWLGMFFWALSILVGGR